MSVDSDGGGDGDGDGDGDGEEMAMAMEMEMKMDMVICGDVDGEEPKLSVLWGDEASAC